MEENEGQQAEGEQQVEQHQQAAAETPEPTLDDIYRGAGLDKAPPEQAAPAQQQAAPSLPAQYPLQSQAIAPLPTQIPNAYDTEAFTQYLAQQQVGMTTLQHATLQVASYLNQLQAREAKAKLTADVSLAVQAVNEVVKHPNPKVIEAMLDAKARDNPQFKALWDHRDKNPGAWASALKLATREIAKDFDVKVDPQLAESQKALKLTHRQMASTVKEQPDDKWNNLSEADFDRNWQRLTGG